ncbi:uncharacterized protein LOC135167968 isoform X2 [Diachasmimorpha longicaudata]|uniref:uncharacterized protein LOC135167968 isoform X2 n=1 Tax=Diachasmimorpha longicaudata TaxID=58733 RepID=UPI0030B8A9DF
MATVFITWLYFNFESAEIKTYDLQEDEGVEDYLVWNPKCHMPSKNPLDSSIIKYVKKIKFEPCSTGPPLSFIEKSVNGSFALVIDPKVAKKYKKFICCWTPITRPVLQEPLPKHWDSKIDRGKCQDFDNRVDLPPDLEIVMLTCRQKGPSTRHSNKPHILYENVHAIWNPAKVQSRLNQTTDQRPKPSIIILGVDSISNLNFQRALPKTKHYLTDTGWINLEGYNKMGDNTFPNLMAILTGLNYSDAYKNCPPTQAYGLDNCPFLWQNFRNAGYVTAYAEDWVEISTFNYQKVGFVNPPTDYYMRPYMTAAEKFLKGKRKFQSNYYCTGPELAIDRIFNSALDFAKTFLGSPYFGFFWSNTVSHQNLNAPSSMDDHFLDMLKKFAKSGVTDDALMVFMSDHGMRWGSLRETFIGWYEERLPFIYIRLPESMKNDESVLRSLRINGHRLTSPYDLYETLRDIVVEAGGQAEASTGCPTCHSLLKPVPSVRGCEDAGISSHWCTCTALRPGNVRDKVHENATNAFLEYVESIVKDYNDKKGKRLCATFRIKKIRRVYEIIDVHKLGNDSSKVEGYMYSVDVVPGGGKFEMTVRVHGEGNYSISEDEISRIDSYAKSAACLHQGNKKLCHCL